MKLYLHMHKKNKPLSQTQKGIMNLERFGVEDIPTNQGHVNWRKVKKLVDYIEENHHQMGDKTYTKVEGIITKDPIIAVEAIKWGYNVAIPKNNNSVVFKRP